MAGRNPIQEILQLRSQGLADAVIMDELVQRGYTADQAHMALSQAEAPMPEPVQRYAPPMHTAHAESGNVYERIEEITENIIDEKWDELIAEVRKIIEWKESVEAKQMKIMNDLEKLKEDFTVLHQGVLGRLQEYDGRMRDVGVELKAVGKVFKDVIPTFVENVKELSTITSDIKKKK